MAPATAAQLQFAAEFAVFLVALAGLACSLRPGLLSHQPWARSALAVGFLALGTVSFLHGSLLVPDGRDGLLVGTRFVAGVVLAVGVLGWQAGRRGQVTMVVGLLALAAAGIALHAGPGHPSLADGIRLVTALAFGAAIVSAGRHSIPARIGINAATLLLAVVLAVSMAVSFTVSRNVEQEASRRYAARAANEADAVTRSAEATLTPAKLVAGSLSGNRPQQLLALLASAPAAGKPQARGVLTQALADLTDERLLGIADPVLFVGGLGAPEAAVPTTLDNSTRLALAGDPVVREALREGADRQGITVVRGRAYALGAAPVVVRQAGRPQQLTGVVVVTRRLDDTYLRVLGTAGEPLSFALVDPGSVLAASGPQPPVATLRQTGRRVVESAVRSRRVVGSRFVVAAPVAAAGEPPTLAFVVSVPTASIDATREALFRNLFVVALGAALVALSLAVVVGERIGSGLRKLTDAADRLRNGDFDARVRVRSQDELGVLGDTFESMAGSIRVMTSELRQAADDEARLRARLQAVVAGMSEALVAVDRDGLVIEFNRAAEELLGVDRVHAVGYPLGDAVRLVIDDGPPVAVDLGSLPFGVAREVDLAVVDGASAPVVLVAGPLRDAEGRQDGAVLVLRDVRREREVEDLKTSILNNISHELRTPLTPIKGYAGVLRDREVGPDRTKQFATEIVAGVDQLERVIGQLVTFGAIAAGRLELVTEPTDPAVVAAAAAERWRGRLDDRHRLVVDVPSGLPPIEADRSHLDQAFDELLDNAVKYSPDGGEITIRASVDLPDDAPAVGFDDEDGRLVFTVSDQGVGIEPDALLQLTDEFAQGDGSTTRRFGGLGLGLAFVERIVRAHGGRLTCTSLPGRGTTFSMLWPVDAAAGGAAATVDDAVARP